MLEKHSAHGAAIDIFHLAGLCTLDIICGKYVLQTGTLGAYILGKLCRKWEVRNLKRILDQIFFFFLHIFKKENPLKLSPVETCKVLCDVYVKTVMSDNDMAKKARSELVKDAEEYFPK